MNVEPTVGAPGLASAKTAFFTSSMATRGGAVPGQAAPLPSATAATTARIGKRQGEQRLLLAGGGATEHCMRAGACQPAGWHAAASMPARSLGMNTAVRVLVTGWW